MAISPAGPGAEAGSGSKRIGRAVTPFRGSRNARSRGRHGNNILRGAGGRVAVAAGCANLPLRAPNAGLAHRRRDGNLFGGSLLTGCSDLPGLDLPGQGHSPEGRNFVQRVRLGGALAAEKPGRKPGRLAGCSVFKLGTACRDKCSARLVGLLAVFGLALQLLFFSSARSSRQFFQRSSKLRSCSSASRRPL